MMVVYHPRVERNFLLYTNNSCNIVHLLSYKQVGAQRKNYKAGKLRKDRFDRLNAIGFHWHAWQAIQFQPPPAPNTQEPPMRSEYHNQGNINNNLHSKNDVTWEEKFNEVMEFKRKHGHFSVPKDYNGSRSLQLWVSFWESPCIVYNGGVS